MSTNGSTIYEVGLGELHRVSQDKQVHDQIDSEFREARGREGARLHVMLKTISEAEQRASENTRNTLDAIGRLAGELEERTTALTSLVKSFEDGHDKRIAAVAQQATIITQAVQETRSAVSAQSDAHFQALSSQARENTERIAVDLRHVRDEVVGLLDSRMTQADASFAALRGDVEVVKFLVMDLIKDRIGRSDPKQKPF